MITQLDDQEARALLCAGRLGRLGCIADGEPYVVPVNYLCDGESLLLHSLPGRKVAALRANPRVCLQVDQIKDQFHWQSVLAYGRYQEITDAAERARLLNCPLTLFPKLTPVESFIAEDANTPAPVVFRVRLERITGIREG